MGYLTSGNQIVDAMGSLNITGNIIPTIWYRTILRENGKPYLLAIAILADIVYWYRPVEVRDPATGQVSGWKKKFSGDILRQSYQYYADLFGESKKTVKMAIDRLETFRVLRREFRTIFHGEGLVSNNVMYLRLVPEQLYRLTYPEAEPGSVWEEKACRAGTGEGMGGGLSAEPGAAVGRAVGGFPTDLDTGMEELGGSLPTNFHIGVEESGGSLPTNSDTGMEKPGGSLPTNSDTPMEKLGGRGVQNGIQAPTNWEGGGAGNFQGLSPNSEGVPSQNVGTYTEITSENTYRDYNTSINPSIRGSRADMADGMEDVDACMALIRRNIEYEHHMRFDRSDERSLYEELYAVICEVVCVRHRSVRVGGEEYPHALVKERFLKLGEDHLRYVIECMRNTSTRITNIKAYMITALYNAPMTMNHYYQQEVNYDMHGGGWQNAEVEREKE
ncbi:DUF6017 domain-containing protein [uncultured Acetatifactor sp.]|uniref:DUF6017 domain-containing protein n=1 Tax=uncultured Acetatifactor sp. TaxID=1671927 RepID=UPI00263A2F60|nr:DUF6017 domain-containing protein [uncultured Acetatifactor sp.]